MTPVSVSETSVSQRSLSLSFAVGNVEAQSSIVEQCSIIGIRNWKLVLGLDRRQSLQDISGRLIFCFLPTALTGCACRLVTEREMDDAPKSRNQVWKPRRNKALVCACACFLQHTLCTAEWCNISVLHARRRLNAWLAVVLLTATSPTTPEATNAFWKTRLNLSHAHRYKASINDSRRDAMRSYAARWDGREGRVYSTVLYIL